MTHMNIGKLVMYSHRFSGLLFLHIHSLHCNLLKINVLESYKPILLLTYQTRNASKADAQDNPFRLLQQWDWHPQNPLGRRMAWAWNNTVPWMGSLRDSCPRTSYIIVQKTKELKIKPLNSKHTVIFCHTFSIFF